MRYCPLTHVTVFNTRTGKGGRFCPPLMFFCEYLSKYSFDRRDFFNTCPKINGAPFGAKIEDSSILGGLFLSPQSQRWGIPRQTNHTPDALIFPILIKFGERGYLACQKHWSQS